jgi:hypothetical protein
MRGVVLETLLVRAEAGETMSGWRGFTSRIGFAAVVMRPAPASSRLSWRSGPCSGATRQTALSVSRSETRTSATRLPQRRLREGDEIGYRDVDGCPRLLLGIDLQDRRKVSRALGHRLERLALEGGR